MDTTTRGDHAAVTESYEEWLDRVVNAMPPLSEQQQNELRVLLR